MAVVLLLHTAGRTRLPRNHHQSDASPRSCKAAPPLRLLLLLLVPLDFLAVPPSVRAR
jgi:hypothetical protein